MPAPPDRPSTRGIASLLSQPAWLVAAFCMALRLFSLSALVGSSFYPPDDGDGRYYLDWASRIAGGMWTDGKSFYGLPLYPYLLAVLKLVFPGSLLAPLIIQAIADSAIAFIITDFSIIILATELPPLRNTESARNLGKTDAGVVAGLIAGLGWCLFQPAQAYSLSFMPTVFGVLALWTVVRVVVGWQESPSLGRATGFGVAMGVAAIMVANLLILIPLIGARLWQLGVSVPRKLAPLSAAMAILAGLVIGTSPCWIHNYFIAGEPVIFSAHAGINFYVGNQPGSTGYTKMPPGVRSSQAGMIEDGHLVAEAAEHRTLTRAQASDFWARQARQAIRDDPKAWLALLVTKARNYWNVFQYDDISVINALQSDGVLLAGPRFGLIAALGLAGLVLACRTHRRARWVAAAVGLHFISVILVFVTERYRIAAVPGLLIGLGVGLVECWRLLATGRWATALGWYFAPLAASVALVSLPTHDSRLWSLDLANSAKTLLEHGRVDEAGELAQRAYAYNPNGAEMNFLLANFWLTKGDRNQAKKFYWQTLNLDPNHARAWNNSGVMAIEEKRWSTAVQLLTRAVALNPRDAKTRYLLARALQGIGNFPAALEMIGTASALDPHPPQFRALTKELQAQLETGAPPTQP